MKIFLSNLVLICLALIAFLRVVAAENLLDVVEKAQKKINQKYPDESSIARKLATKELEQIARSAKSEEDKIAAIREKVPDPSRQMSQAAEQGDAEAQYKLGLSYYIGEDVEKDYTKAVKWFRKAADQGHAEAQTSLGACYSMGNGVNQDYNEAVKWFRKAADQGQADAQFALGACYCTGKGVSMDVTEGIKWYQKAADQGMTVAQDQLDKLSRTKESANSSLAEYQDSQNALNDIMTLFSLLGAAQGKGKVSTYGGYPVVCTMCGGLGFINNGLFRETCPDCHGTGYESDYSRQLKNNPFR